MYDLNPMGLTHEYVRGSRSDAALHFPLLNTHGTDGGVLSHRAGWVTISMTFHGLRTDHPTQLSFVFTEGGHETAVPECPRMWLFHITCPRFIGKIFMAMKCGRMALLQFLQSGSRGWRRLYQECQNPEIGLWPGRSQVFCQNLLGCRQFQHLSLLGLSDLNKMDLFFSLQWDGMRTITSAGLHNVKMMDDGQLSFHWQRFYY